MCISDIEFQWLCLTNHELADNQLSEPGIRLMATTQKTLLKLHVLKQHFHSTPAWPCPGKVGSSSKRGSNKVNTRHISELVKCNEILELRKAIA